MHKEEKNSKKEEKNSKKEERTTAIQSL